MQLLSNLAFTLVLYLVKHSCYNCKNILYVVVKIPGSVITGLFNEAASNVLNVRVEFETRLGL